MGGVVFLPGCPPLAVWSCCSSSIATGRIRRPSILDEEDTGGVLSSTGVRILSPDWEMEGLLGRELEEAF